MERVEKLENSTEESLGIEETVCMKSVVRNWRDPTHHRKVKRKRISLRNRISDGRESEGNIVPIMIVQENAVYGKVPYFIYVCREGKSASCKGRGFNKESESENHRMEELLFHQEKRKVDAGSRLVHYLHFYKMV